MPIGWPSSRDIFEVANTTHVVRPSTVTTPATGAQDPFRFLTQSERVLARQVETLERTLANNDFGVGRDKRNYISMFSPSGEQEKTGLFYRLPKPDLTSRFALSRTIDSLGPNDTLVDVGGGPNFAFDLLRRDGVPFRVVDVGIKKPGSGTLSLLEREHPEQFCYVESYIEQPENIIAKLRGRIVVTDLIAAFSYAYPRPGMPTTPADVLTRELNLGGKGTLVYVCFPSQSVRLQAEGGAPRSVSDWLENAKGVRLLDARTFAVEYMQPVQATTQYHAFVVNKTVEGEIRLPPLYLKQLLASPSGQSPPTSVYIIGAK